MQLTDAYSVFSVNMLSKINENLSQIIEQRERKTIVFVVEISQLLLNEHTNADDQIFTILFFTKNNDFRIRHVDSQNKVAVIIALRLFSDSHFLTNVNDKRLKLTDSEIIMKKAHSKHLKTVLSLSQSGVQEFIRRFENDL